MGVQGPTGPIELPDLTRTTARSTISAHAHNPSGATAIGDGLEAAHDSSSRYRATTSSHHRVDRRPRDRGQVHRRRRRSHQRAGLRHRAGTAEQVKPAALTALTNGTGGYTLMTGALGVDQSSGSASTTCRSSPGANADVVLDPEGFITPGASTASRSRWPNRHRQRRDPPEPVPGVVGSRPGDAGRRLIDPASLVPGVAYVEADQNSYYRVTLPVVANGVANREGVWHASSPSTTGSSSATSPPLRTQGGRAGGPGPRRPLQPRRLHVHQSEAASDALPDRQRARRHRCTLRAVLTEYGLPVDGPGGDASNDHPPGHHLRHARDSVDRAGRCSRRRSRPTSRACTTCWSRPSGHTLRGRPFTREQILHRCRVAWRRPAENGGRWRRRRRSRPGGLVPSGRMLALGRRAGTTASHERLEELGVDLDAVRRCIAAWCDE